MPHNLLCYRYLKKKKLFLPSPLFILPLRGRFVKVNSIGLNPYVCKKINAGWNIYLSNTEIRPHLNTEIRPHLINEQRYIYLIRHIDAF